jgi:hypothetical protein
MIMATTARLSFPRQLDRMPDFVLSRIFCQSFSTVM